ncbi:MAG: HEPN domain-containing protein [Lachnospiraceae bacterium]
MLDNKKELMRYRLEGAREKLDSSKLLLENGNYKDSIGCSYYAMFSAVRAILALDGVD